MSAGGSGLTVRTPGGDCDTGGQFRGQGVTWPHSAQSRRHEGTQSGLFRGQDFGPAIIVRCGFASKS